MRRPDRYANAAALFDAVLQYFGPNGENWLQGAERQGAKRCLVDALFFIRDELHLGSLSTILPFDLLEAEVGTDSLVEFNDACTSFAELRALILKARVAALRQSRTRSTADCKKQRLQLAA